MECTGRSGINRSLRGDQCLGQHLPAVDHSSADVAIAAPVDVVLDRFQIQETDEVVDVEAGFQAHRALGQNALRRDVL